MTIYTKENLIRVDSYVDEYFKYAENLSKEYNINEIAIESLKRIFKCFPNDEELYLSYEIDNAKSKKINSFLKVPILFDFEKYDYYLQRCGEYKNEVK